MTHAHQHPARTVSRTLRAGFTLVELLVTISIIVVLVSLITVAYSKIIGSAKSAANTSVVNAIGQGVESFRNDFASKPPPLITSPPNGSGPGGLGNASAGSFSVPQMLDDATDRALVIRDARYYSEWTLATYLLGNSDLNGDGVVTYSSPGNEQANLDDGHDGPGFRDPGPLLAWKRRESRGGDWVHEPAQTGRIYGPYLEPGFDEFIETVDLNGAPMQRFTDSYGNPIRYYRGYLTINPSKGTKDSLYMPSELFTPAAAEQLMREPGINGSGDEVAVQKFHAQNREVMTAEYTILAANDDPARWITGDGEQIRPYGDATIGKDQERRDIRLLTVAGIFGPFRTNDISPAADAGKIGFENWRDMIRTNVRYTP